MNTITKIVVLLSLCFITSQMKAQDTLKIATNQFQIDKLELLKETIKNEEREFLKVEVEAINQRLENGEINETEAEKLKKEAAKRRALNIENRLAIIDNRISLLMRNENDFLRDTSSDKYVIRLGSDDYDDDFFYIGKKNKQKKYDRRTINGLIIASGANVALVDGVSLGDTPYEFDSHFGEIGWVWKTRMLKNSNFARVTYGFSFQWNRLSPKDNLYFVKTGDVTTMQEFPTNLSKSQLRLTNLVFPVHFEFGPSKKIERSDYFRYSTFKQFKAGIGGYAGFNIGTQQKLVYTEDGDRVRQKTRTNYNTNDFVYGVSAYVGVDIYSLYFKYDVSPIFKDQAVDQNNISLGLRMDFY